MKHTTTAPFLVDDDKHRLADRPSLEEIEQEIISAQEIVDNAWAKLFRYYPHYLAATVSCH